MELEAFNLNLSQLMIQLPDKTDIGVFDSMEDIGSLMEGIIYGKN